MAKSVESTNVEPLVAEWLKKVKIDSKIKKAVTVGVPLAAGDGTCSPEALQLLIALCACPAKNAFFNAHSSNKDFEYLPYLDENDEEEDELVVEKPHGTARAIKEISSWLDCDELSLRLDRLFFVNDLKLALVALGRFGGDQAVRRLVKLMSTWDKSGGSGPKSYSVARGALIYNDSIEAMKFFESQKMLKDYAEVRGVTADELRDAKLSNLGFGAEGTMTIDLGA